MTTAVKDRILETLSQLPPTATVEDAMDLCRQLKPPKPIPPLE